MVLGSVTPWVTRFGVRVDGWQDEAVLILGVAAACIVLVLARTEWRWLAAGPLLIGLTTAALVANDIRDPSDVGPLGGTRAANLEWGIYLVLAASATLALASALMLIVSPQVAARRRNRTATEEQAALWHALPAVTPFVTAEHRDALFLVPTRDPKPSRFVQNPRPRQFVRLARALSILRDAGRLPTRGVFVDVGAHVGTTSIMALLHHGFSEAVSIEPDPDNVRMLRASAELNGVAERIHVIHGALSDSAQKRFFVPGRVRGGWAEGRLTTKPTGDASPVETVRLDDLVADGALDLDKVGLVWCGHPVGAALIGSATAFFARRVPLVLAAGARDENGRLLLNQLAEHYEHAVDLRADLARRLSSWEPRIVTLDQAAQRTFRRHTDLLVF